MQKPPIQKPRKIPPIKTAFRLPPDLHAEIKATADRNGRPMNAEIIARLQAAPVQERLDELIKSNTELKRMVKQLLDK